MLTNRCPTLTIKIQVVFQTELFFKCVWKSQGPRGAKAILNQHNERGAPITRCQYLLWSCSMSLCCLKSNTDKQMRWTQQTQNHTPVTALVRSRSPQKTWERVEHLKKTELGLQTGTGILSIYANNISKGRISRLSIIGNNKGMNE